MRSWAKASSASRREKKLPVFVFPEEIQFFVNDESAHKQVLTLYNPYEFTITFQVLSNAPHRYSVLESQGTIRPHCCVDIVVRHKTPREGPFDIPDKFRIDLYIDRKLAGRKQVTSTLVREKSPSEGSPERERLMEFPPSLPQMHLSPTTRQAAPPTSSGPTVLMMVVALVCLLFLLLPQEGESPGWPAYAHITVNQKLIAAFALGLVTMAILKS